MATETAEEVRIDKKWGEKTLDLSEGKLVEKKEEPPKDKNDPPEKKEEPKKEDKKDEKKDEKKEDKFDLTAYLKDKFGSDSEEEILNRYKSVDRLSGDLEEHKKQLEEAKKPKEYEWKSEKEKAIANFLKDWDTDNIGEGYDQVGRLMKMDPDKVNGKIALQEKFVMENSELSREDALELFNEEYNDKYVLDKDKFDSEEDYKKKQKIADIKKEKDEIAARKMLAEQKEKLKYKKEDPKKDEKKEEKLELPKETVNGYLKQIDEYFKPEKGEEFDGLVLQDDKDDTISVKVAFDEKELKELRDQVKGYIQSGTPFDFNSKKIPNFDPEDLIFQVAMVTKGKEILDRTFTNTLTLAKTLRAEQLAGVKPTKKSSGTGESGPKGITEQFLDLAKKEQEKPKHLRGVK